MVNKIFIITHVAISLSLLGRAALERERESGTRRRSWWERGTSSSSCGGVRLVRAGGTIEVISADFLLP